MKNQNLGRKILFILVLLLLALFCLAPGVVLTTWPEASLFWKVVMTVLTVPAVWMCLYYYRVLAKTPAKEYPLNPFSLDLSFLDEGKKQVNRYEGVSETKTAVMILLTMCLGIVIGFDISGVFSSWKIQNDTLYALILTGAFFLCVWVFPASPATKENS